MARPKLSTMNIDCREPKYQMTPLMIASLKGSRDIVVCLTKHGANVKLKDSRGNTALQLACMKQRFHVIDALLQSGANPNEVNETGWNCLTTAVNYFHEDNASMLLLLLQVRKIQLGLTGKFRCAYLYCLIVLDRRQDGDQGPERADIDRLRSQAQENK